MIQKSVYREDFKNYLKRLGYSGSSQRMLPRCVAEFLEQLAAKNICQLSDINPVHIRQHYQYLTQRPNKKKPGGLSSRMITHHIYAIRLFLNYQEQLGTIQENPISGLRFPQPESTPRAILTQQEIQELYQAAATYREKAILGIFYGCGLRRSEGEALNIKDISFKSALLYVRKGKGNTSRAVPIHEKVLQDFKNYLYYERWAGDGETAFICNRQGKRATGDKLGRELKGLLQKTGIANRDPAHGDQGISLHSLRHSIATHLLENGLPVEYVRDFLGHKHLEATQVYTRVSRQKLMEL